MKSKTNDSAWASLLSTAIQENSRKPTGPGWQRLAEIQKQTGIGMNRLRNTLGRLIAAKKAEFFEGTELNPTGRLVRATWYRPLVSLSA